MPYRKFIAANKAQQPPARKEESAAPPAASRDGVVFATGQNENNIRSFGDSSPKERKRLSLLRGTILLLNRIHESANFLVGGVFKVTAVRHDIARRVAKQIH